MTAVRSVLCGIVQKVCEHLSEPHTVCVDVNGLFRHCEGELMIPLFDYGPGRFHRGMDDFDQIEPLFLELQLVARNSTDVEQIIRQTREISHLSFDDILLSLIHISEPTRQAEISYAVFCLKIR